LSEYNIEVGGGLGQAKGKIWRIGLMGETCYIPEYPFINGGFERDPGVIAGY